MTFLANGLKSSIKSAHLPHTMLSFMHIIILTLAHSLKHNVSIQLQIRKRHLWHHRPNGIHLHAWRTEAAGYKPSGTEINCYMFTSHCM